MTAPTIETAPLVERATTGARELCHVVCNVYTDKTFCGITSISDEYCQDENCDKECAVCLDLEKHLSRCPVCHQNCEWVA